MLNVTKQQARNRYVNLLPSLQDAIFSVQTAEVIESVCEQNSIPAEKVSDISRAVGFVFLGFIHPEDLAQEISDRAALALPVARTLSDSLAVRLFASLRDDINKSYAPAPLENELPIAPLAVSGVEPPKPLEDVKKPIAISVPPPAVSPVPTPSRQPVPAASPASRLSMPPIPKPPPATPLTPFGSPAAPRPATPPPFGTIRPPITPSAAAGEPAPKIIQEEVEFKPLRQQSGFGINIPIPKSLDGKIEKEKIPAKPAVLEFGNQQKQNPLSGQGQTIPTAPRVVHYSEYRTPINASQNGPEDKHGDRNIREITAAPSVPPPPPSYGNTARSFNIASQGGAPIAEQSKPPSMPPSIPPPSPVPPRPAVPPPPRPPVPPPKIGGYGNLAASDALLNEKELPPGKM